MEDGIESMRTTLYDRIEEEKKYLYVHIFNNNISDYFITHNKKKAIDFANETKCIIQIFKRDEEDTYHPTGTILPQ